jgi:signal transduction histidine kinase
MALASDEVVVVDERAALLRIAGLVARDAPDEAVFAAVCELGARLLGADAGAVVRFVGDERGVVVGAWREGGSRGLPVNAELDFDRRHSALARVRATRRAARADGYEQATGEFGVAMRASGLRSSVVAPILMGEEPWGGLVAATTRAQPLPAGGEQRLLELADLVAEAVAGSEARRALAASRRRIVAAADEARRRLERELHEGASQQLMALTLKLRVARGRAEAGSKLAALLDDALAEAIAATQSLRELARQIHPTVLSERGLAAALGALAARAAVPVGLRELPGRRFSSVVETTAYLVACEALANISGARSATEAALYASDRGDTLVVEVRHDGTGAALAGVLALDDRVAALGGRLEVESPDGATVVRAELPLS